MDTQNMMGFTQANSGNTYFALEHTHYVRRLHFVLAVTANILVHAKEEVAYESSYQRF